MGADNTYGQIFVKGAELDELLKFLRQVYAADGYVPFDVTKVPKGYPALKGEFRQIAYGRDGDAATCVFLLREYRLTFETALALSREVSDLLVVACVSDDAYGERWKGYENGQVVLKLGDDPDDELLYEVEESDEDAILEFAREWGVTAPSPDEVTDVAALLGIRREPISFKDAVAGRWPFGLDLELFVSKRSRLYMEG